jgi:hypothetical protein
MLYIESAAAHGSHLPRLANAHNPKWPPAGAHDALNTQGGAGFRFEHSPLNQVLLYDVASGFYVFGHSGHLGALAVSRSSAT